MRGAGVQFAVSAREDTFYLTVHPDRRWLLARQIAGRRMDSVDRISDMPLGEYIRGLGDQSLEQGLF